LQHFFGFAGVSKGGAAPFGTPTLRKQSLVCYTTLAHLRKSRGIASHSQTEKTARLFAAGGFGLQLISRRQGGIPADYVYNLFMLER